MLARILRMIVKEFLQLRRDRAARFRLIVPPIVQMLVYGYAATFEVHRVPTAVLDLDHSQESRELLERFTSSRRFELRAVLGDRDEIAPTIDRERATIVLQVPPGFAALLRKGRTAPLQVILDGTNSNTALIALGYVNQVVQRFADGYALDRLDRVKPQLVPLLPSVTLEQRPWYNPDFNSRWFFVPGVVGSLALVIIANLTAFAVVREREMGTLEQVIVTPIRRSEFILGKTVPFFLVGLAEVVLISLVGTLWFEVPFRGDPLVLLAGGALFLLSMLGVGLLISTVCTTQQQAFASSFFFLSPAFLLSGFSFPISSMPTALQWLTYLFPLRYFLIVLRGTFLKGVGFGVLWPQMAGMAAIAVALLTVSVLRFRKSLE